jgi:hypothetical protein
VVVAGSEWGGEGIGEKRKRKGERRACTSPTVLRIYNVCPRTCHKYVIKLPRACKQACSKLKNPFLKWSSTKYSCHTISMSLSIEFTSVRIKGNI